MGSLGRKIKLAKTDGTKGSEWALADNVPKKPKCSGCHKVYKQMSAKQLRDHYNNGAWDTCPDD